MKVRDKERNLLVATLLKSGEYILAILVLGSIATGKFDLWLFVSGLGIFVSLVMIALYVSSKTKGE